MDWAYLAFNGASGCVLVMWDIRMVEGEFVGDYTMACSFKSLEDNFMWVFSGMYGLNEDRNRHLFWEELVKYIFGGTFLGA